MSSSSASPVLLCARLAASPGSTPPSSGSWALPRLARIKRALTARLRAEPPAAYVGIDAPDFNLRVERELRAAGIRTVQYVCPSVWAWRSGRVRVLRQACDRVLCLLPFEVAFLK